MQRLEQSNTLSQVQRWADEGIPIEAMGTPSKMQAFRQRKGTPVPWNIEQQNRQSVQRSKQAASDTSPAGKTQVPDSVRDVVSEPGAPVAPALRKPVESEIGQSLEHARVHRSPAADAACDQLNARAFTLNNHVAVRSDQPELGTPAGQHLMSHELTHVAQQTGGAVSLLPDAGALEVDPDPQLEKEAEETAQRVMQGGDLGIQRLQDTSVHVQRSQQHAPPLQNLFMDIPVNPEEMAADPANMPAEPPNPMEWLLEEANQAVPDANVGPVQADNIAANQEQLDNMAADPVQADNMAADPVQADNMAADPVDPLEGLMQVFNLLGALDDADNIAADQEQLNNMAADPVDPVQADNIAADQEQLNNMAADPVQADPFEWLMQIVAMVAALDDADMGQGQENNAMPPNEDLWG